MGLSGLRTVPLAVAVAVIHVTALAAVDTDPYYGGCRMRRCRVRLWFHLLRCWRRPHPPNAGYSRVWVRGLSLTCQREYPARFMGARQPPPHVPTGLVSLVSLECVRGDGVQVIHCGIGCMSYLAGSPRAPLTKATHGGSDGLVLLKLQRRNCCTKLAPCINSLSSVQGPPAMQILSPPCRFTGAQRSGCQWGVSIW